MQERLFDAGEVEQTQPDVHTMVSAMHHAVEDEGLLYNELEYICSEYAIAYDKPVVEQTISQLQRRAVVSHIMLEAFLQRRLEIERGDST